MTGKQDFSAVSLQLPMFAGLGVGLLGGLLLFYTYVYSVHTDLAGIILSSRLAETLGASFPEYSSYFPPAERAWYTLAVWLSDATGFALDLSAIMLTGVAVLFSAAFAYHIRRRTVGCTPLFLIGSIAILVILPILYKNVFGLREHIVTLGLWPYLVLRVSDPNNSTIGWKTRMVLGLWLGATLSLKYLFCLVVLLIELVDAAVQRRPQLLFRIENLISGTIVALYLFFWLGIDPAQREAIAAVVDAIDANLASPIANVTQAALHSSLALFFLLLAYIYKLPLRTTLIGLALVVGAIVTAWIQSRWYSHHLFPITTAYIAWLWLIHRDVKLLWLVAISILFVRPIVGEFAATSPYQRTVAELERAMDAQGLSLDGKRVGLLAMHPAPFNQYLARHGATRWIASMNNSYVSAELQHLDVPENKGLLAPAVKLDAPGRQMLHDEVLRLWEDAPPEVLILDESRSWPLNFIEVKWKNVFANDARFNAILSQYREVSRYDGDLVTFTYYERADTAEAAR